MTSIVLAYMLFGSKSLSLEDERDRLELLLGVNFEARESVYRGGSYFRANGSASESLLLRHNFDILDKEVYEPAFSDRTILLLVNETARSDVFLRALGGSGFDLLRCEYI